MADLAGTVRIYRVGDDSVHASQEVDSGGALTIRSLEPGAYVARDEAGNVSAFSVGGGVEEVVIQEGFSPSVVVDVVIERSPEPPLVPDESTQIQYGIDPLRAASRDVTLAREATETDRFAGHPGSQDEPVDWQAAGAGFRADVAAASPVHPASVPANDVQAPHTSKGALANAPDPAQVAASLPEPAAPGGDQQQVFGRSVAELADDTAPASTGTPQEVSPAQAQTQADQSTPEPEPAQASSGAPEIQDPAAGTPPAADQPAAAPVEAQPVTEGIPEGSTLPPAGEENAPPAPHEQP